MITKWKVSEPKKYAKSVAVMRFVHRMEWYLIIADQAERKMRDAP